MAGDEIEALWGILADEVVPSAIARIPTKALQDVTRHISAAARTPEATGTEYRQGLVAGRRELARELAVIIHQAMAEPVKELYDKELKRDDG